MENTSSKITPEANPSAISVRIGSRKFDQVSGARNHDLRRGHIPKYVDQDRLHLNDILIAPPTAPEFRQICKNRRGRRAESKAQRAMRSDSAVVRNGIITFGTKAQKVFEALDRETQNQAFFAIAQAIANRLRTTLCSLVVHRDETAVHAHFMLPAVNEEGHPISQATTQSDIGRLQDLAAEVIAQFAPSIERGHKKLDRLRAGASYSDTVNRSVKELHQDLPFEIAAKKATLQKLATNIANTEAKLAAGSEDEKRLVKRLATYLDRQSRLMTEITELEGTKAALRREIIGSALAAGEVEKQKILDDAREKAKALVEDGSIVLESFQLVAEGKVVRTTDTDPKWTQTIPLDPTTRGRFERALGLGVRSALASFSELVTSMKIKLAKVSKLVVELDELRGEMSLNQKARLERAKSEFDDLSP